MTTQSFTDGVLRLNPEDTAKMMVDPEAKASRQGGEVRGLKARVDEPERWWLGCLYSPRLLQIWHPGPLGKPVASSSLTTGSLR